MSSSNRRRSCLAAYIYLLSCTLSATVNKNLDVSLLSHLGDDRNQYTVVAVEVLQDATTVIAANGNFTFSSAYNCDLDQFIDDMDSTNSYSSAMPTLITIEREANAEYAVTTLFRLATSDQEIDDICSNGMNIAAIGEFGLLAATYSNEYNSYSVIWHDNNSSFACGSGTKCRCDMGTDSKVVAYVGAINDVYLVRVYEWSTGEVIATSSVATSTYQGAIDVAIDTVSGSDLFFMIGWRQITSNLQVPWIFARSYTSDTSNEYELYNTDGTATGDTSDARGINIDVYVMNDGNASLWIQGFSSGGVPVWRKQPDDLSQTATQRNYDDYTRTTNTGGTNIHYTANLDPATGEHRYGQFQQMRLTSTNKGNSMTPQAMALDVGLNRMYYAQDAACCLEFRDELTVNNQSVGSYGGSPDGLLWITNTELTERYYWTVFTKSGTVNYKSNAIDVAANNGMMAYIGKVQSGGAAIEINAFAGTSKHESGDSAFLVLRDQYYGSVANTFDNALCGVPTGTASPSVAPTVTEENSPTETDSPTSKPSVAPSIGFASTASSLQHTCALIVIFVAFCLCGVF